MMQSNQHFYAPGKLLLTAEYFVLDGALALAVPTRVGQEATIKVLQDKNFLIHWEAYHQDQFWLKATINYSTWEIVEANLIEAAQFVLKLLRNCSQISNERFIDGLDYHFLTRLQFPSHYGLGSSSTLMSLVGQWANVDPFLLNELVLGGSGYDIAVAQESSAILYENFPVRKIQKIHYQPHFASELIFIHLNQKQNSREGIATFKSIEKNELIIKQLSQLTLDVLNTESLEVFSSLMSLHEDIVADYLNLQKVKDKFFQDCPVFVKSLGAWGGDFVLSQKFPGYSQYFADRGFADIWDWESMVLG